VGDLCVDQKEKGKGTPIGGQKRKKRFRGKENKKKKNGVKEEERRETGPRFKQRRKKPYAGKKERSWAERKKKQRTAVFQTFLQTGMITRGKGGKKETSPANRGMPPIGGKKKIVRGLRT